MLRLWNGINGGDDQSPVSASYLPLLATGSQRQSSQLPSNKEFASGGWDCRLLCGGTGECGHAVCWKRGGSNDAGAIDSSRELNRARWYGVRPPPDVVLGVILGTVSPFDRRGGWEGGGGGGGAGRPTSRGGQQR